MMAKRAAALAHSRAPAAADNPEAQRAAAVRAANAAVNVPANSRLYSTLPALPVSPKLSSSAVKQLAASRRAAALARLPRADGLAPSMNDLWRPGDQVVEV